MMMPSLVRLDRVSRHYLAGQVMALCEVSLTVQRGEWLTILGPSGSGKTTLLNLMCGMDRPSYGRVFFDDRLPSSLSEWTRIRAHQVGFIFQAFHLLPTLTALENVQIPMFGQKLDPNDRRTRAWELLGRVGMQGRAHHLPGELSGGERQRVAIARSLTNNPALILADEPTGNLDSHNAAKVIELLWTIHQESGVAVVLATHNPTLCSMGRHWVRMVDGRIVEEAQGREGQRCDL